MPNKDRDELERRFRTRISTFVKKQAEALGKEEKEKILRQFTPSLQELLDVKGFRDDPLDEEDADIHPFNDVVHKYPNKILYLTTDECPVYCRYCTRKRKTLLSEGHKATPLTKIVAYLGERPEICEVVFSGGDPMMLPNSDLIHRMHTFLSVESIHYVRIHTRAITTQPSLFSKKFLHALKELKINFLESMIAFVFHINTPYEINPEVQEKIKELRALKIPLFAQSVLLKGVNDDAQILAKLYRVLLSVEIQPYYLHQLDRVTGSAHFEVSDTRAKEIYSKLKELIPPYMLPRLMRDSKKGKISL
ncbi:MAG: L-lysine 2,3-aminomutase [Turneriella sp.]|nr:L-lysine 2,3-aminomutase [Turneriella sp.]